MRRLFLSFLLVLCFASSAFATAVSWFVNTDCADPTYGGYTNGSQGDGTAATCAASAGAAGAYLTLGYSATHITQNLVAGTTKATIDLRGALQDTSIPVFSGITSSSAFDLTLLVQVANRHQGFRDATKYTIANANSTAVIVMGTPFMTVDGLQIISTSNVNADNNMGLMVLDAAGMNGARPVIRDNLIFKQGTSTGNSWGIFFNPNPANYPAGAIVTSYNNGIGYLAGSVHYTFGIRCVTFFAVSCRQYNNTIKGVTSKGLELYRFEVTSDVRVKNNLVQSSGVADYSLTGTDGTLTTATNVTSDTTSPDGASYRSLTAAFGPYGTLDFRLDGTDTSSYNRATDLSADPQFPFSTDHIGTSRPQSIAWDIGDNERIGAGPTPTPGPGVGRLLSLGVGQ